ncbi:hypothetical protein NDU88_009592 [Pleurodeles waltl]|uniref:Methylcytosine dioxygenase n=1 Tax=Pleurodeles waltl TaxID=8319 RepID=A0AAV7S0V9_PLEWA|nr:hypothetical protein NDU88_009592 [Pleurodeles waltl]
MRSGRLRTLAEGKVKPLKPQRRAQGKGKCSAKHSEPSPQSSRQDQLVTPLTPFQLYFKQTGLTNKADFLNDPTAAFFSNPDTDVGLPTTLIPQPLITGQLGPELLTNPTQQLGVALPCQETSKDQAPKELSDPLLQGQQINFSYLSSPIAHKTSQAGRIATMAQVHAQERETSPGAHLQVLTGNPSNSELPISTGNATECVSHIANLDERTSLSRLPELPQETRKCFQQQTAPTAQCATVHSKLRATASAGLPLA